VARTGLVNSRRSYSAHKDKRLDAYRRQYKAPHRARTGSLRAGVGMSASLRGGGGVAAGNDGDAATSLRVPLGAAGGVESNAPPSRRCLSLYISSSFETTSCRAASPRFLISKRRLFSRVRRRSHSDFSSSEASRSSCSRIISF
jgi:hypothetical protein